MNHTKSGNTTTVKRPTEEEMKAFRAFWVPHEAHHDEIQRDMLEAIQVIPEFVKLMKSIPPQQMEEQSKLSRDLQRAAIHDGRWDDYIQHQRAEGIKYAKMGVAFPLWFEILTSFRRSLAKHITSHYRNEPKT
ncbi:MAG: hypothetical protein ACXVCH_13130, partial [Bdellovibrionota bacterium]